MKRLFKILAIIICAASAFSCFGADNGQLEGTASPNPAAFLKTDAQKEMVSTLREIINGNLYTMDYTADYRLDELMTLGGASTNEGLIKAIMCNLTNLPLASAASQMDYGCSGFIARSPEGDVLAGRNFDYHFASASNIFLHDYASKGYKSLCFASLPFLDIDAYVAGALSDGKTDLSMPTAASVYCCMDGMNEEGLFIAVLSLKGGGSIQRDPAKASTTPSLIIRLCLDNCKTVDEAVETFKKYNFSSSDDINNCHFLIADTSGKSVVVEYWRPGEEAPVADIKAKDWTINVIDADHVTNFYLTEPWRHLGGGQNRYDILHSTLDEKGRVLTEDECMDLLKAVHSDLNPGEITSNTQWSVVYNLTKKTATICMNKDYTRKFHYTL